MSKHLYSIKLVILPVWCARKAVFVSATSNLWVHLFIEHYTVIWLVPNYGTWRHDFANVKGGKVIVQRRRVESVRMSNFNILIRTQQIQC